MTKITSTDGFCGVQLGLQVVGGVEELVRVVHGLVLLVRLHGRADIGARYFPVSTRVSVAFAQGRAETM